MSKFELQRPATHPGEILREEFFNYLDMSQNEFAARLKVSFRTINEILNEKRNISSEMALRLSKFLGTSVELWLGLQSEYDVYKTKQKIREDLNNIHTHKIKASV